MENTSLSLLQRACTDRDSDAWGEFYDLYSRLIESWLRRYGIQSQDAEDVRQEVMAIVIRELPTFDHNGRAGAFRNWLRTTTANRLRQFYRDSKKPANEAARADCGALAEQLQDPNSDLSRAWRIDHDRFVLGQLLQQVEPSFKSETVLAFRKLAIEGLEAEAVAKELETTINAVRISQSRVLRALRKLAAGLVD